MLFHMTKYHFYQVIQNLISTLIMVQKNLNLDSIEELFILLVLKYLVIEVLYFHYAT
jgi:hypothetical protein